jgi:hypothetical protein
MLILKVVKGRLYDYRLHVIYKFIIRVNLLAGDLRKGM